ncbi:hypothetical protein L227DRAFT_575506 [Lentinus tigrinus ALCF2SS1-6]|uniref:Uncharacterized protein n=3 Tax=Lentinus tigrinus TaxID=5365 RepID=A0A5C2S8C7_9APHY|nr:hypothetical protein L227DRAFT_575506 [Lentinus tigrinus ALCF2SS1-6]
MEEWKRQEAERKKKNTAITAHFEAAVEEWRAEQQLARDERRRPRWKKPEKKEYRLLPKISKPPARKRAKQAEDNEDEEEVSSSAEE